MGRPITKKIVNTFAYFDNDSAGIIFTKII